MRKESASRRRRTSIWLTVALLVLTAIGARQVLGLNEDQSKFPKGYDAVQAAPESHRVIFENAWVRVLQVSMPAPGKTEPMHHHHWPSFWLEWDTGGKSPHIRYHQPGNVVKDIPSEEQATHPGRWVVRWMNPEPLHAIETVQEFSTPTDLPAVRIEIKTRP